MSLYRREPRAMCSAMNVSSVFNFNGFFKVSDKAPELVFHIFFGDWAMTVEGAIERHLIFKVALLEVIGLLLELLQRIQSAFFEPKLAVADQASRAVPLCVEFSLRLGVKAGGMVGVITRVTNQHVAAFVSSAAALTPVS